MRAKKARPPKTAMTRPTAELRSETEEGNPVSRKPYLTSSIGAVSGFSSMIDLYFAGMWLLS